MFVCVLVGFEDRDDFGGFPGYWDCICVDYFVVEVCDNGYGVVGKMFDVDGGNVVRP